MMVYVLGYFVVAVSLLPLIRNDNWVFRIFEYPRAQKLVINCLLLLTFLLIADWGATHPVFFVAVLAANAIYLFYQIFPYTFFARKQMQREKNNAKDKTFRLLVYNVYQDARKATGCLDRIRMYRPDLIILVETDEWWKSALGELDAEYPYRVLKPLDNTYGMLLYSKLELIDPQVRFLVEPDVPSIHTRVRLLSGDTFVLHCVHPKPPVPQENPRATERDGELLLVAKSAKASKLPVIVAGDLNDVAWSYTTELFMKISGLLDPRRGRGFFNTFHAKYWFLRWPLDHIFCSKEFLLSDLKRLPAAGSDHFPILVELGLNCGEQKENEGAELKPDESELEVAEEKIERVR